MTVGPRPAEDARRQQTAAVCFASAHLVSEERRHAGQPKSPRSSACSRAGGPTCALLSSAGCWRRRRKEGRAAGGNHRSGTTDVAASDDGRANAIRLLHYRGAGITVRSLRADRSGRRAPPQGALQCWAVAHGQRRRPPRRARAIRRPQGLEHVQLHRDNLVAGWSETQPHASKPMPSYPTLRRFMRANGFDKRRRLTLRTTRGAEQAEASIADREIRSYESEYVNALWHWDCHHCSRKVLTARGEWVTPILVGVLRRSLAARLSLAVVFGRDGGGHRTRPVASIP